MWATVTIPSSYIEDVWKSRNPTATEPPKPEDLKPVQDDVVTKIENIVEPLLLLQANKGQNTYKHVQRRGARFAAGAGDRAAVDGEQGDGLGRPILEHAGDARRGDVQPAGAAIVVKGAAGEPDGRRRCASPALTLHADEPAKRRTPTKREEPDDERPRLRLKKGKSLKDDLVEIVREDPDAAADILRSWIGKAG